MLTANLTDWSDGHCGVMDGMEWAFGRALFLSINLDKERIHMLSKFSVKKPYTVLVAVVLAIVLGVVAFTRMTTDLLPNISLPYVIVMTT